MVRPLFFEYREDPTSWLTEDQYMFGTDLLVAPLMEEGCDRGTDRIGWCELELAVLCAKASTGEDTVSLRADGVVRSVRPARDGDGFGVLDDPREGTVRWKIRILD